MKKVMYGLMAAALSLGLAAPSFAAVSPRADGTSHVVKVQQTTKKKVAKKKSSKKTATAKKAKKKPVTQG
ncbi:MAG TPA: hypothetical protein VGB82_20245 [Alphaproteobacteria bacterium]